MSPALISNLKKRATLLKKARAFFDGRGIIEVDVPILSQLTSVDLHIDLIQATCCGKRGYLFSSPEYGMKRLLSEGIGDIYQLSHVFRDGESGRKHLPEFTMAEWYRIGFTYEQMIEETLAFCRLFIEEGHVEEISYKEAFLKYAGCPIPKGEEKDRLFSFVIEPHLGKGCFTVVKDFLPEDAALAQLETKGEETVAKRFEIFYNGYELANGYQELIDPKEQQKRLEEANVARMDAGKQPYPIDTYFLEALKKGVPSCCGVAVGFDRLMMLHVNTDEIRDIVPFSWN